MTPKEKSSIKAVLLSAFVCPGAGQIYKRQITKGITIIALFLFPLFIEVVLMIKNGLNYLQTATTIEFPLNPVILFSHNLFWIKVMGLVILLIWIYALIDAYLSPLLTTGGR